MKQTDEQLVAMKKFAKTLFRLKLSTFAHFLLVAQKTDNELRLRHGIFS